MSENSIVHVCPFELMAYNGKMNVPSELTVLVLITVFHIEVGVDRSNKAWVDPHPHETVKCVKVPLEIRVMFSWNSIICSRKPGG
jgi:hypothetical protein